MIIGNRKVVLNFPLDLEVCLTARLVKNLIQERNFVHNESFNNLELFLIFYVNFSSHLLFGMLILVINVFWLEITFVDCFKDFVLLLTNTTENECPNLDLEIGLWRVAAFVEYWRYLVWLQGSLMNQIHQFYTFYLFSPTHIMSLIGVENLKVIYFVVRATIQLNSFTNAINLRWVALLHYDFDNKLAFKIVSFKHRHILNLDLYIKKSTSYLSFRSTLGYIFSRSCLIVSLKLSLSLR